MLSSQTRAQMMVPGTNCSSLPFNVWRQRPSSSGNASIRDGNQVWVTATGVSMSGTTEANLAELDLDGQPRNRVKPSKEWAFHTAILRRRTDVRVVLHAHPSHAIAASTFLESGTCLPSVTPQFVLRLGRVPVAPYHPPGSAELTTHGVRTVLVLDAARLAANASAFAMFDAVVVGTQNRSVPPEDAAAATRMALRALRFEAMEVVLPLSPGVPYGFPLPTRRPLVVLKSGNFGATDLYTHVRDL